MERSVLAQRRDGRKPSEMRGFSSSFFFGYSQPSSEMAAVDPFRQGGVRPIVLRRRDACERLAIVPGHPLRRMHNECGGMAQQLGQVLEGIDATQLAGMDEYADT